jgi:DNA-binding CsgD family transcriptional regulator
METSGVELSEREREIICLVATGASNKEIAQQLSISTNTVKVHLRNIFAKIEVVSRTEATLYAIREGLVPAPGGSPEISIRDAPVEDEGSGATDQMVGDREGTKEVGPLKKSGINLIIGAVVVLLAGLAIFLLTNRSLSGVGATPTSIPARWQSRSPLPVARSGLAAAVVNDQIYAIGGNTEKGITGELDRYSPVKDTWETLPAMPVPVSEASAAVLGGKIYIPGGRLPEGKICDEMQVFDPETKTWRTRAKLPKAVYGYALVSLEGKLYLIGGWTQSGVTADVYMYNPDIDQWAPKTGMKVARGYAGAGVTGGEIFVIGGNDGKKDLIANEVYFPERGSEAGGTWQTMRDLPTPMASPGVVSVIDNLYVIGSGLKSEAGSNALVYLPSRDDWASVPQLVNPAYAGLAMVTQGNSIFVIGGKNSQGASSQVACYQMFYTVALPGVVK